MSSHFVRLFQSPGDNGDDDDDRAPRPRMPPWFGHPDDELGAVVPLGLVVGRSEGGVVALPHATVYSTGVAFDIVAIARGLSEARSSRLFYDQHGPFEEGEEPPPGFLRIGLELPDGERVSNLVGRRSRSLHMKPDEQPEGSVFIEHGGGGGSGGDGRVTLRPAFWLWPLPDRGTIQVFCEWPVVEIPLSTIQVDGAVLAAAAARVVPLWPAPSA